MKTLIKLSGKVIDNKKELEKFVLGIKKISKNNDIIIVHGGGKQVTEWSEKIGLETKFVNGLRFTDEKTLDVVLSILSGLVNKKLVFEFIKKGINTVGLSCIDGKVVETNIEKSLGFVGNKIKKTDTKLIEILVKKGFVVLISSVGIGEGNIVNINADNIAYALAKKLKVDKLIFLTDKEGVLDKEGNVIKEIKISQISNLIKTGIVTEGMIPKLNSIKDLLKTENRSVIISNNLNNMGTVIRR